MISEAIHSALPETYTKKHGLTYVFGLEHGCTSLPDDQVPSKFTLADQIALNVQLQERIKELDKEVDEYPGRPLGQFFTCRLP